MARPVFILIVYWTHFDMCGRNNASPAALDRVLMFVYASVLGVSTLKHSQVSELGVYYYCYYYYY